MARFTLPFPVLPGKTEDDIRSISDYFMSHPEEYVESRRQIGATMERVYWQHTPMGDFVVVHIESTRPIEDALAAPAQSDFAIDKYFVEKIKDIHGIDLTQPPPPGPTPEVIGEWSDPAVTGRRRGMAFSAPGIPGTEDRGRAWARETYASDGMTTSRRALGLCLEMVTLVQTPRGPVLAVYLEGEDPFEANRRFAASTDPFDVAFKEECTHLFPPFIDFNQPVPGISELFDSERLLARR
jgi:hypothetical protein